MKRADARRLAIGVLVTVVLAVTVGALWRWRRDRARWVVYPEEEVATVGNPHAYKGQPLCQKCHPHRDERLIDEPIKLCSSCHAFDHKTSHPVDVVQKNGDGVGLPLGEGGRILCHTCHPYHDLGKIEHALWLPYSELCLRCHQGH